MGGDWRVCVPVRPLPHLICGVSIPNNQLSILRCTDQIPAQREVRKGWGGREGEKGGGGGGGGEGGANNEGKKVRGERVNKLCNLP